MAWREEVSFGHAKVRRLELLDADFVIGTEAANVINVGVQLKDAVEGRDVTRSTSVGFYLSANSDGSTLTGTAPDALAIGTDGLLLLNGGDVLTNGDVVSESDGDIDLNITHAAGALTYYLVLVMPTGRLVISPAITFAA